MSEYKLARVRNESRRLLSSAFNSKEQVININTGNTFAHELSKFLLCWELAQDGKRFVTEAIFKNGKRADIFILDECEALEVLHSETNENFRYKVADYPCLVSAYKTKRVLRMWQEQLLEVMR